MKRGIFIVNMLWLTCSCLAQEPQHGVSAPDHRIAQPPIAEESTHYGWAEVLRVDPVYEQNEMGATVTPTDEPCYEEQVTPSSTPPPAQHSDNRVGGTIIGALIGGVVGNLFGHGGGRKVATAAGAVAGGVVGNNVAAASDATEDEAVTQNEPATAPQVERVCPEAKVAAQQRHIVGYDVEYRYRGEIYLTRLPYDPGDRMRVKISVVPAD